MNLALDPLLAIPLLFAVGAVAGTLNVLAGGGSFLTLPVLIFLGLPAGVANGTNRVGILLQNVSAVWSFDRHGVLDRRSALWAALPATAGAVVGTLLALEISDEGFRRLLAFLMVAVSLASFWRPEAPESTDDAPAKLSRGRAWILGSGFFAVGVYGGFVQAGVGFLILAATTFAGLDLVRGNAVKVLAVLCFTPLSLGIFAWDDKVRWLPGLALGAGMLAGGLLGARFTVLKGHRWLRGVVTAAVVVFAVLLWVR